jgi:DNA anti-recombination protein RmuC
MQDPIHVTWETVASTLALGVTTLAGLLWAGQSARVTKLEERADKHDREDHKELRELLDEHAAESRGQLERMRESVERQVSTLHEKLDRMAERRLP